MAGADTLANSLFTSLLTGETLPTLTVPDFTQPQFSVSPLGGTPPTPLTNAELTTGAVDGTGVFDVLMASVSAQLQSQLEAGRINASQFSGAYIQAIQAVLPSAVQFLLGRDQAYWQALLTEQQAIAAQAMAVKALVDLETAKAQYAAVVFEAYTAEANFALTKIRLATESIQYDTANFQLSNILPQQLLLVTEQTNSQRAQTSATRQDGTAVAGLIGGQVALYNQQCISYRRASEVSAAKLFTDAFNTQVTVDSGTTPPTNFSDATLDLVLTSIRENNNLTGVQTP